VVPTRDDIDAREFVTAVKPLLERRDLPGLVRLLSGKWTAAQIVSLLHADCCDTRKVAALSLSLVGCRECLPDLVRQLRDPDPMINQMAEHAVWSIWFRMGTPQANCEVHRGVKAMDRRDFDAAVEHFTRAIGLSPTFAEAYNQRATAHYLLERYDDSIADALAAVQHCPEHFGAWAGLGHCYACLGQINPAIEAYERALSINPRLECLHEAIAELKSSRRG